MNWYKPGSQGPTRAAWPPHPARARRLILALFCVALASAVVLTGSSQDNSPTDLVPLGIILLILSTGTFLVSTGPYLGFVAAFSYGSALFIAFPAVFVGLNGVGAAAPLPKSYSASVFVAIVAQSALLIFARNEPEGPLASGFGPRRGSLLVAALIAAALSFTISLFGQMETVSSIAMALSIVASSVYAWSQPRGKRRVFGVVCVAVLVALYLFLGGGSFGRLARATTVLAALVAASILSGWRGYKLLLGLMTAPAVILLSAQRLLFLAEERGTAPLQTEGLGSVVGPFTSSTKILEAYQVGTHVPTGGSSFLTSALFWIPRRVWPDKPPGFGREIVPLTQPDLVSTTAHSGAASIYAEFVWNFGYLGLLVGGAILCVVLIAADGWLLDRLENPRPLTATGVMSLALLIGALPNLAWGGTFPFVTRLAPFYVALAFHILATVSSNLHGRAPLGPGYQRSDALRKGAIPSASRSRRPAGDLV